MQAEVINNFLYLTNANVELKQDYGLYAKLGPLLGENTLFYGLIGSEWGYFTVASGASFSAMLGGVPSSAIVTGTRSGYQTAMLYGMGIEYALDECATIALEYHSADYGKIPSPATMTTVISTEGVPITDSFISTANDIHANFSSLMLKLTMYFH